jgi:trans-aconitate methyltransferase
MIRPNLLNFDLPTGSNKISPFKKIYKLEDFDYLDSKEALPLFEKQAELIIKHNYQNIIDVGCRTGRINDILNSLNYNYEYMGFDTSEEPIVYSQNKWKDYKNIEYRIADWDDIDTIKVDFNVDCVLFSGVLCYVPDYHLELFNRLVVDLYQAEGAIIQDLRDDQINTDSRIDLKYIYSDLKEYKNYYRKVEEHKVDCDFYYGQRSIFDVRIYED